MTHQGFFTRRLPSEQKERKLEEVRRAVRKLDEAETPKKILEVIRACPFALPALFLAAPNKVNMVAEHLPPEWLSFAGFTARTKQGAGKDETK